MLDTPRAGARITSSSRRREGRSRLREQHDQRVLDRAPEAAISRSLWLDRGRRGSETTKLELSASYYAVRLHFRSIARRLTCLTTMRRYFMV